jgi:hypothetical protein
MAGQVESGGFESVFMGESCAKPAPLYAADTYEFAEGARAAAQSSGPAAARA